MLRRCLLLFLAAGCQSRENPQTPASVEVRDQAGALVAQLTPGHPCKGKLGNVEMDATHTQTAILRLVRQDSGATVLDPKTGIPALRIFVDHGGATISGPDSRVLRHIESKHDAFAVDHPPLTVTGTRDPVIAALLTSSELAAAEALLLACGQGA